MIDINSRRVIGERGGRNRPFIARRKTICQVRQGDVILLGSTQAGPFIKVELEVSGNWELNSTKVRLGVTCYAHKHTEHSSGKSSPVRCAHKRPALPPGKEQHMHMPPLVDCDWPVVTRTG